MKTVKGVEMILSGESSTIPSVGKERGKEYKLGFRLGYWERASEVRVCKH